MFGAVAGAFTGLVTTPLDVLKTRMMLDGAKGGRRGCGVGRLLWPAIGWLGVDALDVLKTRMILGQGWAVGCPAKASPILVWAAAAPHPLPATPASAHLFSRPAGQYKNVFDCASQIMREEGASAMLRCAPPCAAPLQHTAAAACLRAGWGRAAHACSACSALCPSVPALPLAGPSPSPCPPCCGRRCRGWQPRVMWIGIGGSVFFTVLEAAKRFYAPKPQPKPCCADKKQK